MGWGEGANANFTAESVPKGGEGGGGPKGEGGKHIKAKLS